MHNRDPEQGCRADKNKTLRYVLAVLEPNDPLSCATHKVAWWLSATCPGHSPGSQLAAAEIDAIGDVHQSAVSFLGAPCHIS